MTPQRTGYRTLNTVVTLLLLATVLVMAYAAAALIWMTGLPLLSAALSAGFIFAAAAGLVLALGSLLGAAIMGVGAVRTLSRMLPLGVSGTPPRTWQKLAAFSVTGIMVFVLFFLQLAIDLRKGTPTDDTLFAWPVVATLIVFVCTILIVRNQHRRVATRPAGSFILFLRRFSSYSDRVVLGECLKACPPAVPLVLLVPSTPRIRDWNPVSLAFSGLRLRSPLRSLPVFYRAEDAAWEDTARQLIHQADRIVFDTSDASGSIGLEASMITEANRWPRVVALIEAGGSDGRNELTSRAGTAVRYSRTWRMGALLLGLLVAGTTTGGVITLIENLGAPNDVIRPLGFATWALLFVVFFFRPRMDEEGARQLRRALRQPVQHHGAITSSMRL